MFEDYFSSRSRFLILSQCYELGVIVLPSTALPAVVEAGDETDLQNRAESSDDSHLFITA